jgi:hypothetical protein
VARAFGLSDWCHRKEHIGREIQGPRDPHDRVVAGSPATATLQPTNERGVDAGPFGELHLRQLRNLSGYSEVHLVNHYIRTLLQQWALARSFDCAFCISS